MKILSLLTTGGLISVFGTSMALGFDPAQVQLVVADQRDCPWCDLTEANFSGVDFGSVDLEGADLTDAKLVQADLSDANLAGAYLTRADLTGANLKGATLAGAIFYQVDFTSVDLTGVALENTYCDWATKFPADSAWICRGVTIARK